MPLCEHMFHSSIKESSSHISGPLGPLPFTFPNPDPQLDPWPRISSTDEVLKGADKVSDVLVY
jgi:hypothetical protein